MLYSNTQNMPITTEITIKGNMGVGGCDLVDLAKEYGTPLYVMDEETLRENCRTYLNSFHEQYPDSEVVFASKAQSVLGVLRIIQEEGLGIDVVSGGELFLALKAGFAPDKIYFHGNNKTPKELEEAMAANVGHVVVDNLSELELLNNLATQNNKKQKILIRVTPGIEAHTHDFVKTGHFDSKFGFHIDRVPEIIEEIKKKKNIDFQGLHAHIGSQILEVNPFSFAAEKMADLIFKIKKTNNINIPVLSLGGGLGISYLPKETPPTVEEYAKFMTNELKYRLEKYKLPTPKLIVEPGRSIVGRAGVTLYTIGAIKENKGIRKYLFIDGGMSDNPRPITYQAKYDALLANKLSARKTETVTIAGKFCESGDILIKDILLPKAETGETLVVLGTGAYNFSMASRYNQTPVPAMVLVNQGKAKVIVQRETYEDLIRNQE